LEAVSSGDKPYRDLTEVHEVEEIMNEDGPAAILDFWSETCGPCRSMAPMFEKVAGQFESGEVQFCKINTTRQGELAAPFNIRAVPTILFVNKGQIVDSIVGAPTAQKLGERAEWLVKKSQKRGLLGRIFG
jgi:thioredoxin